MELMILETDKSTGGRPPAREALIQVAVKLPLSQHRALRRLCSDLQCRPSDAIRTALANMIHERLDGGGQNV